jgi:urea ABC transporter permease protein UrtC
MVESDSKTRKVAMTKLLTISKEKYIILALFVGFLLYPLLANIYLIDMMCTALILGIFALSLDLIWGYTGVLNLGHAAFFGLGSYSFVLTLKHIDSFNPIYLALIVAIILPAVLAMIIGFVTFLSRTTEIYFAIITLAVSLLLEKIALVWYDFTGGSNGIINIPTLAFNIPGVFSLSLDSSLKYYYFVLTVSLLVFILCKRIVSSAFGRVLISIRENEQRTAVLGYNTAKYRITIYCIAGGIAGLSGAMFGPLNAIVYPSLFGLLLSAQVLIWVAVGGRGTLIGAFMGAAIINILEAYLSDVSIMAYLIVLGIVFILVVLLLPQGFAGLIQKSFKTAK